MLIIHNLTPSLIPTKLISYLSINLSISVYMASAEGMASVNPEQKISLSEFTFFHSKILMPVYSL